MRCPWLLVATCAVLLTACSSPRHATGLAPVLPPVAPSAWPMTVLPPVAPDAWPTTAPLGPWDGVTNLVIAPDGSAWVSYGDHDYNQPAGGGVTHYAAGQVTNFTTADGLPNDSVQALAVAPDGSVWAGTLGCGIARFDGQAWHDLHTDCGTLGGHVVDFAFTPDGATWAATGLDLVRFAGRNWTRTGKYAASAAAMPDGSLWITGWEGRENSQYLARYDGRSWTILDQGGDHSWFQAGADGAPWVRITAGNGLLAIDVWNGAGWTSMAPLTYTGLRRLSAAPGGTLWALTDQGLAHDDGTTWVYGTDALPGLTPNALAGMTQLAFGPDGSLWLGGQGGRVAHYEPRRAQLTILATPLPMPDATPVQITQPNGPVPTPTDTPPPVGSQPAVNHAMATASRPWVGVTTLTTHPFSHDSHHGEGKEGVVLDERQEASFIDRGQFYVGFGHGIGTTWLLVDKHHLAKDLTSAQGVNHRPLAQHLDSALHDPIHNVSGISLVKDNLTGGEGYWILLVA